MAYREIAPSPALRRHVACYWERTGPVGEGDVHRVLPDGCMDLLFAIGDGEARAMVVGTMTRAIVAGLGGASFFGVRFHPGEAFAFLDVVAGDARDTALGAEDAGCRGVVALEDALASARDGRAASHVDAWLRTRLSSARAAEPAVRRAVALLTATRGAARIVDVAAAAGVGERRLERAFAERVGIAPKALARVFRLQSLVERLDAELARGSRSCAAADARLPWARLAAEAGYADQAHLSREVRALSGVTPTTLASERAASDSFKPRALAAGMDGHHRHHRHHDPAPRAPERRSP